MFHFFLSYLPKLEGHCTSDLKAYSCFLEGGENGKEIRSLKEYFYCLQIVQSANPATTTLCDIVDVCAVSYPMRAMGYFPSKSEVNQRTTNNSKVTYIVFKYWSHV